jgi:hypothetical protein
LKEKVKKIILSRAADPIKKQERGEKITNKKRKSLPNQKKPAHTKIKRRERQKKKR